MSDSGQNGLGAVKSKSLPHHASSSGVSLRSLSSMSRGSIGSRSDWIHPQLAHITSKIEPVIRDMQHIQLGVKQRVKSNIVKLKSSNAPCFSGSDMVTWLMSYHDLQSRVEACNIACLFCQFGYVFPVDQNSQCCTVKDDSTMYRFQETDLWISHKQRYSDFNYAIYLLRRLLLSKRKITLTQYELERLKVVKLKLTDRWENVVKLAEQDEKILKNQKKAARISSDAQEAAFWHTWRPPPNHPTIQDRLLTRSGFELHHKFKHVENDVESAKREIELLKKAKLRRKVHISTSLNHLMKSSVDYQEFDPILNPPLLGNPWISGSVTFWNSQEVITTTPDVRQVRRWAYSLEELLYDRSGRDFFERFCWKQHSAENIRFWQACRDLQTIPLKGVPDSVKLIYSEFLSSSARSAVNLSAEVRATVKDDVRNPQRFSFAKPQEQILDIMRRDIYPRFLKSDIYLSLCSEDEKPVTFSQKVKELFRRSQPLRSTSDIQQNIVSPLSPVRYSRTNVSIGKRHPRNLERTSSFSSSAEHLNEEDDPFSQAFIDALTMKDRGRMDSVLHGSLPRRHSFPHLLSLEEQEENDFGKRSSVLDAPRNDKEFSTTVKQNANVLTAEVECKHSVSACEINVIECAQDDSSSVGRQPTSGGERCNNPRASFLSDSNVQCQSSSSPDLSSESDVTSPQGEQSVESLRAIMMFSPDEETNLSQKHN